MSSIFDWSTASGSNTSVDGINVAEGCPAGNVNNAIRSIMAFCRNTFSSGLQSFFAGSTPLPVSNGGTGTTTGLAVGAAASGANADITSLSALTTPLSAAQGGTGVSTLSALLGLLAAQAAITITSNTNGIAIGIPIGGVTYYVQFVHISAFGPGSASFSWPVTTWASIKAVIPGISSGIPFSGSESCAVTGASPSGGTAWANNGSGTPMSIDIVAFGY